MLGLALSMLLAATPDLAEEKPPAQAAAWVNFGPLIVRTFSVGVSSVIGPRLVLTIDGAWSPALHPLEHECADTATTVWGAAGLMIRPFGGERELGGFFLQPKLSVRFTSTTGPQSGRRPDGSPCFRPYADGNDVSVGLSGSVGWNWVVARHLYLGVSAGGGGLACFNCASYESNTRRFSVLALIDLGLRVGVAF